MKSWTTSTTQGGEIILTKTENSHSAEADSLN